MPTELGRLRTATRSAITFGRTPPIASVEAELKAYFGGGLAAFLTPLALHGSPFTRATWAALQAIPSGAVRSYAQVAATMGQPTAARAVAHANGANQIAIIIPCHRVVGSDGALTGYGGGLWRKRWLIQHEKQRTDPAQSGPGSRNR